MKLSNLKEKNLVLPKSLQAIIDRHNELESPRHKPVLFVSFSGGRTSAYMSKWLIDNVSDLFELCFTFANTGQEHEKTLEFVDQCDKAMNMRLVWVEADVQHGKRIGSKHKIVNYRTASRNGDPFEEVIKKYGLPNPVFQLCNREMKLNPLNSYRNLVLENLDPTAFGFAIGIRADEADRMSAHAEKNKLVYPLIGANVTKQQVIHYWSKQPFDLQIPEHMGNCVTCYKKTDRKLYTIAKHEPERFEFFQRMESLYSTTGAGCNSEKPRRIFRKERTTADIIASSKQPFVEWSDQKVGYTPDMFGMDQHSGCEESCEAFGSDFDD